MKSLWTLSVLLILSLCGLSTAGVEDEARLKVDLFSNYDKTVAPETPLVLTYSVTPHRVVGVDTDKGLITADLLLSHTWQDRRLAWDPSEYNVTDQSIIVPRDRVFLPDMELLNGFATELLSNPEVIIYYDGTASYVPLVRAEVYCDLPSRPFEEIVCDVRIGPWSRTNSRVTIQSFTVDSSSLLPGGKCTVGQLQAKVSRQTYICCPGMYETAVLSLNVSCLAPEITPPVTKVTVECPLVEQAPNSAVKSYMTSHFLVAPIYIVFLYLNKFLG